MAHDPPWTNWHYAADQQIQLCDFRDLINNTVKYRCSTVVNGKVIVYNEQLQYGTVNGTISPVPLKLIP
jgi:hypothetical protein